MFQEISDRDVIRAANLLAADAADMTWDMEDGAPLQTHNFGVVSNGWQIRGTGEFDLV